MYNKLIINSIVNLLEIKSVKEAPLDNMPFGKGIYDALQYFLNLANNLGFETKNYDNYIGEVIFGSGEEDFAVLCHLDTVPASNNWTYLPYAGTIANGKIYGRGAMDDKSAAIICLYALKRLKDENFMPTKRIKLIVGCDEESGWKCIEHYKKHAKMPKYGFSPDADFPVIYAEKGILQISVNFNVQKVQAFSGGTAGNMVCDYALLQSLIDNDALKQCALTVSDGVIYSTGKSAHGSTPHLGINALEPLVKYLHLANLIDNSAYNFLFENNALRALNDQTGNLTMSPNVAKLNDNVAQFIVDIRYPATKTLNQITSVIDTFKINYTIAAHKKPIYSNHDSFLVSTLLGVYNKVTNSNAHPVAIGGGTYARALESGVAFGPEFPNRQSTVHQDDEYIQLSDIPLIFEIYFQALKEVTK